MYHKMNTRELRAGMYIVNIGVSWLKHPYLYATEGELVPQELEKLLEEGYTEAYIDLTRCRPGTLSPELEKLVPSVTSEDIQDDFPLPAPPPPRVALAEELPKARQVFFSSLGVVKDMMTNLRKGVADPPAAEGVVEDLLDSLDRNTDALLSLCKLRQVDDYTYTHCVNVSVLAALFARGLGISGDELYNIGMGGLFHDMGKALIPAKILNAPRRLSTSEMTIVKRHPQLGYEALCEYPNVPQPALQMALEHHEQYCGEGYPNQLPGKSISVAGRIGGVVDTFDALSSRRVYKEPMSLPKSLSILYSMRGKEFFPDMVERFIRLLGVYPIGSPVELEDGSKAVVSAVNIASPLQPKVILVSDRDGKSLGKRECDLAAAGNPAIVKSLTPKELGADPATVLGIPVMAPV